MSYEILDGRPIPKKQRHLKHEWDIDAIEEILALKRSNPSYSWNETEKAILEELLTPSESESLETHKRRIDNRIKLLNLKDVY